MKNIYDCETPASDGEVFDTLVEKGSLPGPGFKLERIRSHGHPTPEGEWYDQAWSEWVMVLRGHAVLEYADGRKETMKAGDYILIEPGCRHRVDQVSDDCVWLALHYAL